MKCYVSKPLVPFYPTALPGRLWRSSVGLNLDQQLSVSSMQCSGLSSPCWPCCRRGGRDLPWTHPHRDPCPRRDPHPRRDPRPRRDPVLTGTPVLTGLGPKFLICRRARVSEAHTPGGSPSQGNSVPIRRTVSERSLVITVTFTVPVTGSQAALPVMEGPWGKRPLPYGSLTHISLPLWARSLSAFLRPHLCCGF